MLTGQGLYLPASALLGASVLSLATGCMTPPSSHVDPAGATTPAQRPAASPASSLPECTSWPVVPASVACDLLEHPNVAVPALCADICTRPPPPDAGCVVRHAMTCGVSPALQQQYWSGQGCPDAGPVHVYCEDMPE